MDGVLQDFRHATRLLMKSPGFVVVAALVLGLGVGANTAIFSIVNGFFLRPLPVEDPGRLVWLTTLSPGAVRPQNLSYPDYVDMRDHNEAFTGLLAYADVPVALAGGDRPERLRGVMVSGNYFPVLGVKADRGRFFGPEEDRAAGAVPVVVLSRALWKRQFSSDPNLVGHSVSLNGQAFTVVGIAPASFTGTEAEYAADLWVPLAMHVQVMPGSASLLSQRDAAWVRVMGRLRPEVSLAQARASLAGLAAGVGNPRGNPGEKVQVQVTRAGGAIHPATAGEVLSIAGLLMAVTGLVLLIACANVANLLLARAAARGRELGIRLALGATRARLVRQLLIENLLVSLVGGSAGFLMVEWGTDLFRLFAELPDEIAGAMAPDFRVFAFALGLAVVSGVLFGLIPALHASRRDPALVLGSDGTERSSGRTRTQRLLVVVQVALSMVLLVSAGLFLRSLGKASRVDPGFDVGHGLTMSFDLNLQGYSREKSLAFYQLLLQRVQALPGVDSASLASLAPLSGRMLGMQLIPEGAEGEAPGGLHVFANAVYPGYFRTLRTPVLRGRDFTERDAAGAPGVAIVNEACARRLWPGQEPLGKRISFDGESGPFLQVIGVAKNAKYDELTEDPQPFVYLAHLQSPDLLSEVALLVRAEKSPSQILSSVQHELRSMGSDLPIYSTGTFEETLRLRADKQRGMTKMLSLFGTLALLLASVGLYGLVAFSVARRTREIGIRMALGARRSDILGLLVGEGMRLTLWGVGLGLALSAALTRALSSMLFGVTPADLATFAGVSLLLGVVGAAASAFPARRAARLDPVRALRHE
ncbi:MAG TPA: ABC transporter permease [Candidatus Polarisedimenticolia bacterium]|nr:ABC transporter permease [Candidatus Polarisedimenticolia bacterium]